jgi:hypothetical protein
MAGNRREVDMAGKISALSQTAYLIREFRETR